MGEAKRRKAILGDRYGKIESSKHKSYEQNVDGKPYLRMHPLTPVLHEAWRDTCEKGFVLYGRAFEPILTGKWEGANWESLLENAIARLCGSQPQPTISEKQYRDLLAKSKQTGYSTAGFAELLGKYGFTRGSEITQKAYLEIWRETCDRTLAQR